jgi:hypothetical protein
MNSRPAGGNRTVESFAVLAKAATQNLSPGQSSGSGAGSSGAPSAGSPAAPTGSDSGAGAGAAPSGTATSSGTPLQATANAAPGRPVDSAKQSIFGMGLAGLAAFMML